MCWVTELATGEQVLLDNCPDTLTSTWLVAPPTEFSETSTPPIVRWQVVATMANICNQSGFILPQPETPHSNLHSCVSSLVPFCTPNVKVTPGLNTQTQAQVGDFVNGVVEFHSEVLVPVLNDTQRTTWTVIAHTRVYSNPGDGSGIMQWDIAIGQPTTVYIQPYLNKRSDALMIALYVVAAIEMALIVVTMILLFAYRNHVIITASSPVFLHLMCAFAILGLGAVYPYGVAPQTEASCIISMWFAGIGFCGLFGCLLSKTFRLWRLFRSKDFRPIIITNFQVLGFVLLVIAPEAIIFIIWSAADTPQPTPKYNADINYIVECKSDVNSLWYALISAYQLIILFAGLALSYMTRKFTTLFRESKFITYSSILMLAAAILTPVQFTEGSSPDSIFILQALQVLLYGLVVYIIIWPKLFRIFRGDNPSLSALNPRTSASGSGMGSMASIGEHDSSLGQNSHSQDPEVGAEGLFKNGVLRAPVAKRVRALATHAHHLGVMIDAADPIAADDMSEFISSYNDLKRFIR